MYGHFIVDSFDDPVTERLSGSTTAWTEVLAALTCAERATSVDPMRAYEAALDKHASSDTVINPATVGSRGTVIAVGSVGQHVVFIKTNPEP
jgi:hypothetical protein